MPPAGFNGFQRDCFNSLSGDFGPVSGYKLQVAVFFDCPLPTEDCRLRTEDYALPIIHTAEAAEAEGDYAYRRGEIFIS